MGGENLYLQMFSIHGLLRAERLELGRDADTGGQINYVIELARQLSQLPEVGRIDLFTRLIADKAVSDDYARTIEQVNDKFRIVRIQCGGRKYRRKELLWPHLDEYVDKTVKFIKREKSPPDIVHGHYADAGYVAMQLAKLFGVPFLFTGHSLGRAKKQKLLDDGMKETDIIKKYKIDHRIYVEEDILKEADLVITSTRQEIEDQYGMYRDARLPVFRVIPPGLDVDKFYPFYHDILPESEKDEVEMFAQASMIEELNRFFMHPDRPVVLSLCRPDKRKNISGLIKAYGEDKDLQSMANLAVFAGIRKDISTMEDNEREVLTEILLLMDKYDLYGKIAIPKKHDFEYEVPELYRIAAEKKGVFVNSALTEPFGLTLLEASAVGLPVVSTNDGGPRDIIENCRCGVLVDPSDTKAISRAVRSIISDSEKWKQYSKNGIINVRKHYTWKAHGEKYLQEVIRLKEHAKAPQFVDSISSHAIGKRLAKLQFFLLTDIDNTLIGDTNADLAELLDLLQHSRDYIGFGIATGRTIDSALAHLKKHAIPTPDVIISSVGAEIYYAGKKFRDKGWETHISQKWDRDKIKTLLDTFDFLTYQEDSTQRKFKISYFLQPSKDSLSRIHNFLLQHKCRYNLIYSHQEFLDILPYRASKGKALRYLSYKWEIPLGNFMVCGDSGNDEEMLRGEPLAVVVGNYSPELEKLRGGKNIYFAKRKYAGGILEALSRFQFVKKAGGSKKSP